MLNSSFRLCFMRNLSTVKYMRVASVTNFNFNLISKLSSVIISGTMGVLTVDRFSKPSQVP